MSNTDDNMDMTQFYGVFFDEAAEHLDGMETLLVDIDADNPDIEQLNAIFRAAHSIKGGAATFGFKDITELTHEMETVFDRVRKGQMPLSTSLVDAFLQSGDMLKSMLAARRGDGAGVDETDVEALCIRLRSFLTGETVTSGVGGVIESAGNGKRSDGQAGSSERNEFQLVFGPFDEKFTPQFVDTIVNDLKDFGTVTEVGADSRSSSAERCFLINTAVSAGDLSDTLAFMADPDKARVIEVNAAVIADGGVTSAAMSPVPVVGSVAQTAEPIAASITAPQEDAGFGLFVDESALPVNRDGLHDPASVEPHGRGQSQTAAPGSNDVSAAKVVNLKPTTKPAAVQPASDASSIRVSVEKVDQLINLVGELVITQAMLAQTASGADPVLYEALFNGLATLERNTRDLQEAAMSIRMLPMSFVFSRFPRVVRDVAAKLGKEVELHTLGEGTELDKSLIERIVDPLTHLVRNSLDHGLEPPDERVSVGKGRKGSITLRAYHHGGAIVIEVSDDGRGLHRDKILAKARERGMAVSDDMSDQDVWSLIFEAGFSTAEKVTDVSGRGVGMDVVRRNIQEMGGRVEIESASGVGTRISIKLPLTLAILDGMSVRVGGEIFILPLNAIAESLQPAPGSINSIAGRGQVVSVRGEYVPVLSMSEVCSMRQEKQRPEDGILVILEAEGVKTALFVDDLVGQHQVVIKSLETNYRKVAGISGATIMGDGRVALILDVAHVVGLAHNRLEKAA